MQGNRTTEICLFLPISDVSGKPLVKLTALLTSVIGGMSSFVAVFGNALVLYVLFKYERLRNPSNILLGNLCLTDFITGCIVVPAVSIRRITEAYGKGICAVRIISAYFSYLAVISSVVTVGFISIDRYYAIMKPFQYEIHVENKHYFIIICMKWILLAGYSILPFLKVLSGTDFFKVAFILMGLAMCVFAISYARISKIVNYQRSKIYPNATGSIRRIETSQTNEDDSKTENITSVRKAEQKKTKTIAILLIAAFCCYGPLALVFVLRGIKGDTFKLVYIADPWADLILYLNSSINPVIYCLRTREIREAVLGILPRIIRSTFSRLSGQQEI